MYQLPKALELATKLPPTPETADDSIFQIITDKSNTNKLENKETSASLNETSNDNQHPHAMKEKSNGVQKMPNEIEVFVHKTGPKNEKQEEEPEGATEPEIAAEVDTDVETNTESEPQKEEQTEPGSEPEPETKPEPEPEVEPVAEETAAPEVEEPDAESSLKPTISNEDKKATSPHENDNDMQADDPHQQDQEHSTEKEANGNNIDDSVSSPSNNIDTCYTCTSETEPKCKMNATQLEKCKVLDVEKHSGCYTLFKGNILII